MATRRMFSQLVTDTDKFLEMPASSQALYFHLGMHGDDDGFVASPKKIIRAVGCSEDDLRLLLTKGFLIAFNSGVVVIRHWRLNNTLKNDRYHATLYQQEMATLSSDETGSYLLPDPSWNQIGSNLEPEPNVTQRNLTQRNPDINAASPDHTQVPEQGQKRNQVSRSRFSPPTLDEVRTFAEARNSSVDPERFYDFYQSKGWRVGKDPMKDWQASFRNWERNQKSRAGKDTTPISRPDLYKVDEKEVL